jgi:prepilin-type N-terminal cleavage/methylation domain-containing protein
MNARGFAMVEVLVAMVVAALGLGLALAMALGGLGATTEARRADLATVLAADLGGRMRAVPGVDWTALPAPVECGENCGPPELAALELADWLKALHLQLADPEVQLDAGPQGAVLLSLSWLESGATRRSLALEIHP